MITIDEIKNHILYFFPSLDLNLDDVGFYATIMPPLLVATGFIVVLIFLYFWSCYIIGLYAKERGCSFSAWMLLSIFLTPLIAPTMLMFFMASKKHHVFVAAIYGSFMGAGFTLFYIPYKIFFSIFMRINKQNGEKQKDVYKTFD